jgi:hypothetical protein
MPKLLCTENDSNRWRLYGVPNHTPFVKDGINDYIVHGQKEAVNPEQVGTKAAAHYWLTLGAGKTRTTRLRLRDARPRSEPFGRAFDELMAQGLREANEFYTAVIPDTLSDDARPLRVCCGASSSTTMTCNAGSQGIRPAYGGAEKFQQDSHWRDQLLFYEYFHGDNGASIGASHQTGWMVLVAKLLPQSGE